MYLLFTTAADAAAATLLDGRLQNNARNEMSAEQMIAIPNLLKPVHAAQDFDFGYYRAPDPFEKDHSCSVWELRLVLAGAIPIPST